MRGDYVGSKSEAIIADRLFANDIPYHYEVAFTPEGEADTSRPVFDMYGRLMGYEGLGTDPYDRDTLHPDFYVLNKRTRKTYYWEHLGRLTTPEKASRTSTADFRCSCTSRTAPSILPIS